jgi:hypothetical protein
MEKGPPCPADFVDDLFGEHLETFSLIEGFIPNTGYQTFPASAKSDHLETLPDGSDGDSPDRRIEAGNISSARQDANGSFFPFHADHFDSPLPFSGRLRVYYKCTRKARTKNHLPVVPLPGVAEVDDIGLNHMGRPICHFFS